MDYNNKNRLEEEIFSQPVWSAVCTNRGPKKLPPMPIATTSFKGFPVAPTYQTCKVLEVQRVLEPMNNKEQRFTQEPLRTFSEKSWILSRTFQTSGTTFFPLLCIVASLAARRATCRTALFSVLFIYKPQKPRIERTVIIYFCNVEVFIIQILDALEQGRDELNNFFIQK